MFAGQKKGQFLGSRLEYTNAVQENVPFLGRVA